MIFLCCHYCWSLLYCDYFKIFSVIDHKILKSLIVDCSNTVCYSMMQTIFHKNHNMTANNAKRHLFVVFNEKSEVKIKFKTFN